MESQQYQQEIRSKPPVPLASTLVSHVVPGPLFLYLDHISFCLAPSSSSGLCHILKSIHCLLLHTTEDIKATWPLVLPPSDFFCIHHWFLLFCLFLCDYFFIKHLDLPLKWLLYVLPGPGLIHLLIDLFFLPFLPVFSSFLFSSSRNDEFFVHWLKVADITAVNQKKPMRIVCPSF